MPNDDIIRRLTISANGQGIDQTTASLNKLTDATGTLATVTETSAKRALSAEAAYNRQTMALDPSARAQANIAKATKTANEALSQGVITQDDHAKRVQLINEKYTTQVGLSAAVGKATQALQLQTASLAGGLGLTGAVLSAFGPSGFAAAVGIGAITSALSTASDMAHTLALKAKEIYELSEATGLSTREFQALRGEAGKFGIDGETLAAGLAKFTVGFQELRLGSGSLLTDIRKINPALAEQMQMTRDSATAFTLFGKAVAQTSDIFERNALLKAGLGRGAAQYGALFATSPDITGLAAAAKAAGRGIDEDLILKLKQLQIDIDKTKSAASTVFATIFGTSTLAGELEFNRGLLEIAKTLRTLSISDDFRKFMDFISNPATVGAVSGALVGATGGAIFGGVGALPGAIIGAGVGFAGGAAVDGVKQVGRSAAPTRDDSALGISDAIPRGRTFDQITKDNFIGPIYTPKTPEAELDRLKRLNDVLGAAATPTEQLALKFAELGIKAHDAGVGSDILARAQNALKESYGIEQLSAMVAAIGAALSSIELLALLAAEAKVAA